VTEKPSIRAAVLATFALAALSLTACAQIGHPFDIAKADQLTPGISTEDDAKKLLGEPISVTTSPDNGHQLLIWQYSYGTALATGGAERLVILFDADGKMLRIVQRAKV
jgi:hypothetical protein